MIILTIISLILNVFFITIAIVSYFKFKHQKKDLESIIDEKVFNDFFNNRL